MKSLIFLLFISILVGCRSTIEVSDTSQIIRYRGNDAQLNVTAPARKMLEDYGYSFPIRDGIMHWCLNGKDCVAIDVEEKDEHGSMSINIKDVDMDGQKAVLVCRKFAWKGESREVKQYDIFMPGNKSSKPFIALDPANPLIAEHCS